MAATAPEIISYWSLDLRVRDPHPGTKHTVTKDNINDLIRLDMLRWEWNVPQLHTIGPTRKTGEPVLPVLQGGPRVTPLSLSLAGDENVVVHNDHIVFYNSALTATVDQGLSDRVLTEPVDGTENVSVIATLANIEGPTNGAAAAHLSDTTSLPLARHQPYEPSNSSLRLGDFQRIQPIFYLEQAEGFILLAEAFQDNGRRRLIYTLQSVTEEPTVMAGPTRKTSIADSQVKATTPAFQFAEQEALHTIRAHQDGNLNFDGGASRRGYLEFWVNGLPLGIRTLKDARFRFRGGEATLFIGGWPRKPEPLYLTGDIIHINFDPINKCTPCTG